MQTKTSRWSRRYERALMQHLRQGTVTSLLPTRKLGQQAVAIGMETLEVAVTHAHALAMFSTPSCSGRVLVRKTIIRSKKFFSETIIAIEQTHNPAVQADAQENKLTQKLLLRTQEVSVVTKQVKRDIIRRKVAEATSKKSLQKSAKLFAEAKRMEQHLRRLTHKRLLSHEVDSKETSRQLRDDTAQTLLAIRIRMLGINQATTSEKLMKKEIDAMQQMMKEFLQKFNLLTLKVGGNHET